MLHLFLVASLTLADGEIQVPKWNKTDVEVFEAIRKLAEQYHEEAKHRKEMSRQTGCPFEPGTYDNVECA